MKDQSAAPGPPTMPKTPEARQRFSRLRRLIHDDHYRQRILFGVSLLAFAIVAVLAAFVRLYQVLPFDVATTREFQELQGTWFLDLMVYVSLLGYIPWSIITVAAGTVLVGVVLGLKDGAFLLGATIVQGLINLGVKTAIGRARPSSSLVDVVRQASGNSFPSGHVMFYTVFFGVLFFLAWTRLPNSPVRWLAMVFTSALVILVGPSRIFLGAHWLSDVIAAYLLGFIVLGFSIEFYLRYRAPTTPDQQEGAIHAYDKQHERRSSGQ
ncbi:MAG TPA: phosphatase PAP2 family protein [Roseiflexaceae bacterium]|nr:phosphatase PAP2 family protein [Roseiflexaceae bacterium]